MVEERRRLIVLIALRSRRCHRLIVLVAALQEMTEGPAPVGFYTGSWELDVKKSDTLQQALTYHREFCVCV